MTPRTLTPSTDPYSPQRRTALVLVGTGTYGVLVARVVYTEWIFFALMATALRWAVRQADLTGATIEAVIAWQFPIVGGAYGWPAIAVVDGTDFAAAAEKTLEEAIGATEVPGSLVTIERT